MPEAKRPDDTPADHHIDSDIRQLKRAQRKTLSITLQQQHGKLLQQHASKQRPYNNSRHIAFYLANDGEIDPGRLMQHALARGKNVYLPILSPFNSKLYFAPYTTGSKLRNNRFNIPEPVCHPSKWRTAAQLDLIFLPLVAFDLHGNRIGMGGGFYDRTLAYLKHRRFWRRPALIGLAHELQKVGRIDANNWDIPLNHIYTEKQCYRAG